MAKKPMDAQGVERERSRILAQAQNILEEGGVRDISMRKLAAKLGFTATTIYRYFASKDELFLSLLVVGFSRLRDRITARVAQEQHACEQLSAGLDEYICFGIEEKRYYNIMFASDYPECRPYGDPREAAAAQEANRISLGIFEMIGNILAKASPASAEPPQCQLAAVWTMLHGFVSLYNCGALGNVTEDVQTLRETYVQRVMRLLCPD